jgi:hypothetical protein
MVTIRRLAVLSIRQYHQLIKFAFLNVNFELNKNPNHKTPPRTPSSSLTIPWPAALKISNHRRFPLTAIKFLRLAFVADKRAKKKAVFMTRGSTQIGRESVAKKSQIDR